MQISTCSRRKGLRVYIPVIYEAEGLYDGSQELQYRLVRPAGESVGGLTNWW